MLRGLGFDFEIRTKDVDESFPNYLPGKSIAPFLAERKANAHLASIAPDELLITADTIVWLDEKVFNKPASKEEAVQMLCTLSGRMHEVFTSVCFTDERRKDIFTERSEVYIRELGIEEINYYVNHFNPLDKAGAYGAQECLPVGMNPCSQLEMDFLNRIGKIELMEQSINQPRGMKTVDMIEKIRGSFFNVMGFPVTEVYEGMRRCGIVK